MSGHQLSTRGGRRKCIRKTCNIISKTTFGPKNKSGRGKNHYVIVNNHSESEGAMSLSIEISRCSKMTTCISCVC